MQWLSSVIVTWRASPMSNKKIKNWKSHHVDVQQIKCFLMSHIENDCRNVMLLHHFLELILNYIGMNENEYMISAIINCMCKLPIIVMMCIEFWIRCWIMTLHA